MKPPAIICSPAVIEFRAIYGGHISTDKSKDARSWKLANERFTNVSNGAHIQFRAEDRPSKASKGVDRYPLRTRDRS